MKKLILGMMLLAGAAAYADAASGDATINVTAHSTGALTVTKGADLDFGNLRTYSGDAQNTTVTVQDTNQAALATTTVKFEVTANTGLNRADADGSAYNVPVTLTMEDTTVLTGNAAVAHPIAVALNTAAANAAPAGTYNGSFTVTATLDI